MSLLGLKFMSKQNSIGIQICMVTNKIRQLLRWESFVPLNQLRSRRKFISSEEEHYLHNGGANIQFFEI